MYSKTFLQNFLLGPAESTLISMRNYAVITDSVSMDRLLGCLPTYNLRASVLVVASIVWLSVPRQISKTKRDRRELSSLL